MLELRFKHRAFTIYKRHTEDVANTQKVRTMQAHPTEKLRAPIERPNTRTINRALRVRCLASELVVRDDDATSHTVRTISVLSLNISRPCLTVCRLLAPVQPKIEGGGADGQCVRRMLGGKACANSLYRAFALRFAGRMHT